MPPRASNGILPPRRRPADAAKENEGQGVHAAQPPKKRARVSKRTSGEPNGKKPSQRKKKPAVLPLLPRDILVNICASLAPLDLLRLSRTIKALRIVLMNRTSRPVWAAALAAMGMPPCPPTMCEPAYARLAFENRCFFCPANQAINMYWALRVRCCNKCVANASELIRKDDFLKSENLGPEFTPDKVKILGDAAIGTFALGSGSHFSPMTLLYLRSDVLKLRDAMLHFIHNSRALAEFSVARKADAKNIQEHAAACKKWHRAWCEKQSDDVNASRERRKDAIIKRLSDLGFGLDMARMINREETDDVYDMWYHRFCNHKSVNQPKDLTPRIWNSIEMELIDFMEDFRLVSAPHEGYKARYVRSFHIDSVLQEYAASRPIEEIHPSVGDLDDMDALGNIFNHPVEDASRDVVPPTLFADLKLRLPALAEQWRHSVSLSLLSLLPPAGAAPDLSRLQLVTTLFTCTRCNRAAPFSYANIIMHRCLRPNLYVPPGSELANYYTSWADGVRYLAYSPFYAAVARTVVSACGLDHARVTVAQMDTLGARFACMSCYDNGGEVSALDWRSAVFHHGKHPDVRIVRLRADDAAVAKSLEYDVVPQHDRSPARRWICTRCRFATHGDSIAAHLRLRHRVQEPQPQDYRLDLDLFSVPEELRDVRVPYR